MNISVLRISAWLIATLVIPFLNLYGQSDPNRTFALVGAKIYPSPTAGPVEDGTFGLDKRTGVVALGMDADLVLLRGDPAAAIQVLDNVAYTFLQGRIIYRSPARR